MDAYEQAKTDAEMLVRFTYSPGWGVAVSLVYDEDDSVSDLDVGVTRIDADTVKVIGNTLRVPFDIDYPGQMWWPVENFVPDLPDANNDCHDARSHWFATEAEAREHAKSVQEHWENPLPWESFIQTD